LVEVYSIIFTQLAYLGSLFMRMNLK